MLGPKGEEEWNKGGGRQVRRRGIKRGDRVGGDK